MEHFKVWCVPFLVEERLFIAEPRTGLFQVRAKPRSSPVLKNPKLKPTLQVFSYAAYSLRSSPAESRGLGPLFHRYPDIPNMELL